jgi:nucleoid-associated protein YgaU
LPAPVSNADGPATAFRPASHVTGRSVAAAEPGSDGHAIKAPAPSGREPRLGVTVVRKNETMLDVALRVYGAPDKVETLWRANRDALPALDTPLETGMLLRTPRIR